MSAGGTQGDVPRRSRPTPARCSALIARELDAGRRRYPRQQQRRSQARPGRGDRQRGLARRLPDHGDVALCHHRCAAAADDRAQVGPGHHHRLVRRRAANRRTSRCPTGFAAAIAGWSKTLASEVGKHGVTVNMVLPGRMIPIACASSTARAGRTGQSVEDVSGPRKRNSSRPLRRRGVRRRGGVPRQPAGKLRHRQHAARRRRHDPLDLTTARTLPG